MLGQICRRFWALFWVAVLSWGVGVAKAASLDAHATALATAEQQRQTLEQMRELADPAYKGLLIALKEGALYTWQGRLLILSDSGAFQDLAGQAVLDAAG